MLNDLENKLTSLYRVTCPDAHSLGEHHLGILPHETSEEIIKHLAHCPHCRNEVRLIQNFLTPNETTADNKLSMLDHLQVIIANLILPSAGTPQFGLSAAGVRGDDSRVQVFQAGNWQVTIDLQMDTQQPEHFAIIGIVTGPPVNYWRVELKLDEIEAGVTDVDDVGGFRFSSVPPGQYTLLFRSEIAVIQLDPLCVGLG